MNDDIILYGLGKIRIIDLLEKEDMGKIASLTMTEAPHYRTVSACSVAEQEAFVKYLDLMKNYSKETEEVK